jgi:uncharacterized Zn finger protein (UPF0148 family)
MSEDFDKEAEREKLREKYEHDKEKREATEQMSELLLQGATMTNAHCSECGDPIFRYEGQEFCPTCEKPVDRGESAESEDGGESDDDDSIQVTTPSNDARVSFGQGTDEETVENGAATPKQSEEQQAQQPTAQQRQPQQQPQPDPQPQPSQPAPSANVQTGGEAGTAAAREALVQTLTRFSQQAAATEDPARAQEHLAAAREAAEALSALRR